VRHLATVAARPEALGEVRTEVERWLTDIGLPAAERADLVVAVNEAAANAVEHAYRDGRTGDVTVEADLGHGLEIRVIDHGEWKYGHGDPERGRGMHIMRSLVDDVEVVRRDGGGTTVVLRRREAPTEDRR
jgi:anti-sigma regulatory factor (Ser/Thr protein kinase)